MSSISKGSIDLSDKKKALFKRLQKEAAARLSPQQGPSSASRSHISPRADRSTYPLSLFQERCWWLEQLNPGDPNLQVISALRLEGVLDIAVLRQCLQQLLQRHELLRAVFANLDGTPVQSILPTMPDEIVLLDLAQLDPDAAENAQAQLLVPQQPHSFDLANGPLFKATLVRYTDLKHVLVLSLHAIVADQATPVLLCHELITLYHHAITGHAVALPELPLCYADYASWQQQYLQHAPLEEEQTYWKQQLAGAPLTLNLPFDYQQPAASAPRQASSTLELECALVRQAQDFCQQEEITLSHLLFTVFSLLLSQYTGQKDILSGFLSPNRAAELEPLVGPFADILPIRIQLADELSGQTLLRRVRQILFDASKHQDLPFSQIVEAVYPQHDLTRLPLFQTVFAHHQLPSCQAQSSGLVARFLPLASSLSLQDLAFIFSSSDQSLHLTIVYNNDLFAADSITRLQEHYQQLLRSFLRHRAGPLSRLSCLTPSEQSCLLHDWNADSLAHLPASDQCIHHLFEQQAQRTPHAIALSDGRQQLTYEQLNCQVNQLAHLLQRRGIGPERLVGLCLSRTPDLVIGLLAILKTGAAYVPLDPTYPRERLAFTIQDARLELVLTQKDLVDQMPFSADQALCLDVPGLYTGERSDNITREMSNKHLAYVIYTSGSTGRPKGVCISHWSAVIFLLWARQQFSDEELAGVLFGTSVCFDLSIFELFAPLSWGGKAILASNVLDLPTLAESEYITLLNTVPSAATALLNGANLPSSLLTINLAGEALTRDLVQTLYQRTSVRRVCNLYGPTEDTTYSTWTPVDAEEQGPVPIGRPLANTQAYIVDVHMQLVPLGIAGELYLGGDGQARGYLHRPDLTAERFVPDPFSVVPGRRLYKTGDLARYRPDGTIDYLGRLDHQVKVRGFRIELGEIEAQLRQHPAIEDVVVVAWEEMPGEKRLVAYVVACSEQVLEPSLLRSYLQDLLPAYMIPSFFLMLDALPRTENGKVDRKALPAPDPAKARLTTSAHDLPQGEREQWLALLWQEVLQLAVVGRTDNFFALGGDSLRAMQLLARLQNDFQVHLSLADLFAAPTIAQLADRCRTATLQPVLEPIAALRPRLVSPDMAFPLSSGQQRLWFVDQLEAGTAMYNVPLILALTGPLNRLALYQALHEMIRRHETLRTTIRVSKGSPFLSIADCPRPALALVDLSLALGADALEVEKPYECPAVLRKMREEVQRPFDLSSGPLLRVCLLCVKENYHILMLTMHHIITDGWSLNILTQELNTLYNAFAAGHPSPLPELAIQYRDFVAWQHTHQAQNFGAGLAYWKECFTPLPSPLALPTDYPRPAMQTFVGDSLRFQIGHELTQEIHAISQQEGVTTFMTLLTAFLVVLMRYSGQEDLVVGTPVANRSRTELERLVGFFVNTLALRADLSGNPTGRELLQRVRVVTLDAYSYQEIPFEQVVEAVQPQRDPSRSPLFQVLFVLQNTPAFALNLAGLSAQTVEVLPPTAQFDLSFILEESPSGLNLTIEYNTQLFAQATIERLQAHYKNLLHSLCTQLDIAIQNLPLLNESECTQIVADWKQSAAAFPAERYLHELFSTVDEAKEFPIANIHCYVLDVLQRPVPIGMVGELYLAGEIVSRGYLEQPGLTAQRFMPDLLSEQPGQRMYRTGDWVYRRADGELVYVERVDQQVRPRHNGKKALSMPDQVYPAEQDVVADLQSPEEEKLLQIWRRVLRRVVVGRRDNFFEIGGHSLLAMQVLAAIREELHADLSIRQFFAAPTIAELAAVIASGVAPEPMLHYESQKDALPSLVPVARTSELPLSFAQQRLWFLDQLEGSSATYTIPAVLQLTGPFNLPVFRQSMRELVRRHEVLRTTFIKGKDAPIQCIHLLPITAIEVAEIAAAEPEQRQVAILQDIQAEVQRPFDLANGPLLRVRILRLSQQQHILIFTMHHIISDGWSIGIMAHELSAIYNAFVVGRPSPLPDLSIQYADFAVWQRTCLQGSRLAAHLAYWKQQLIGAPTLDLPTDHPRALSAASPGATCSQEWPLALAQQVLELSQQEGVTPFMILLTGFMALLAYQSGQEDITTGTPVTNRPHPELERLVGFFVNTLVLRVDLSGDPTGYELLRRVREVTLDGYEHQDVPFEQVVDAVRPKREQNRSPLFQILFVFQNTPSEDLSLTDLEITSFGTHTSTAKFDLSVGLTMHNHGLEIGTEYNSQLFELATIQQFHTQYRILLEQLIANPEWKLSELYRGLSELTINARRSYVH